MLSTTSMPRDAREVQCAPKWEDDARNVERILKVNEPDYVPEYNLDMFTYV